MRIFFLFLFVVLLKSAESYETITTVVETKSLQGFLAKRTTVHVERTLLDQTHPLWQAEYAGPFIAWIMNHVPMGHRIYPWVTSEDVIESESAFNEVNAYMDRHNDLKTIYTPLDSKEANQDFESLLGWARSVLDSLWGRFQPRVAENGGDPVPTQEDMDDLEELATVLNTLLYVKLLRSKKVLEEKHYPDIDPNNDNMRRWVGDRFVGFVTTMTSAIQSHLIYLKNQARMLLDPKFTSCNPMSKNTCTGQFEEQISEENMRQNYYHVLKELPPLDSREEKKGFSLYTIIMIILSLTIQS